MNANKLTHYCLSFAFVLLSTTAVHSQGKPITTFGNPTELKLKVNRRDYNGKNNAGGDFAIETFYPIGWSNDGKFAYYLEPVDEARGRQRRSGRYRRQR